MAELKKEVKMGTCNNIPDAVQSFAVLNCEVGSTENGCNCSNDLLNLPDNDSAPLLEFNRPTIVDLTMESDHFQEDIFVDRPIVIESDIVKSDSEISSKTTECKKHKIPEVPISFTSEYCSPCKVPKVTSKSVCASFINSSNSTITSQSLGNGNTSKTDYLPRHTMEVKIFNEDLIELKPIHYQVLDMFPDIEYNYLIRLCSQESDINQIINILLETDDYPKEENHAEASNMTPYLYKTNTDSEVNVQRKRKLLNNRPIDAFQDYQQDQITIHNESCVVSENNRLEFLISIFPDADRTFLETKSKLKENKLEEFINEATESRNYPKLDVKIDKKAESNDDDELGLYTTAFNIDHFLKIFPEPVKYFMDENRKCQNSLHALEFLKRRYQHQNLKVIVNKYKDLGYNMSRTCQALDETPASRITKRPSCLIRMPQETNLVFLQEACFVEHKAEIVSYITNKAKTKQLEYELAKKNGELIECGCCYDQCLFEDCAACNEGDLFCKSCIKKSAEVRIGDGQNNFPCLQACGAEFSLQLLQNLLDANIFSRLIKRIQLEEVRAADIEGLEVCPFCEFGTIPPPETKIFTCLNPECLKESCRKCHKVSHIPQRCEEIENDDQARARKYIEDEMTKALVRECYKCKKSFIKMEGCNKMTCTCGAIMCYICRQPIKDYKHFNGPGANDKSKCPLFSTDKVLHVDAVTAVAKQALQEINTINPSLQLKYDPTKVLPAAAKSALPPGVHENPVALIQQLIQRNVQRHQIGVQRRQALNNPYHNELPNHYPGIANMLQHDPIQALQAFADMVIDNVVRGHHNNYHFVPPHQPRANLPVQHARMAYNQPPAPAPYHNELPNHYPGIANMLQHLQMFGDVMEHVRRRHEGNQNQN